MKPDKSPCLTCHHAHPTPDYPSACFCDHVGEWGDPAFVNNCKNYTPKTGRDFLAGMSDTALGDFLAAIQCPPTADPDVFNGCRGKNCPQCWADFLRNTYLPPVPKPIAAPSYTYGDEHSADPVITASANSSPAAFSLPGCLTELAKIQLSTPSTERPPRRMTLTPSIPSIPSSQPSAPPANSSLISHNS